MANDVHKWRLSSFCTLWTARKLANFSCTTHGVISDCFFAHTQAQKSLPNSGAAAHFTQIHNWHSVNSKWDLHLRACNWQAINANKWYQAWHHKGINTPTSLVVRAPNVGNTPACPFGSKLKGRLAKPRPQCKRGRIENTRENCRVSSTIAISTTISPPGRNDRLIV